MLKESENPPIIWPCEGSVAEFTGRWWVAQTRSRNEKALAWQLAQKNIQYFLPMTWKVHSSRGRKLRSLIPLFGGYLFFCGGEDDRIEALKTNRIANIIEVICQDRFVQELLPIERALKLGKPLTPHEFLKSGQRCRVKAGPLMGTEGFVVTTAKNTRLILQVEMLGHAASMEIDMDMVEAID